MRLSPSTVLSPSLFGIIEGRRKGGKEERGYIKEGRKEGRNKEREEGRKEGREGGKGGKEERKGGTKERNTPRITEGGGDIKE